MVRKGAYTLSKGVRKHIRREKGRIRRTAGGKEEVVQRIAGLYAKFGLSVTKGYYAE